MSHYKFTKFDLRSPSLLYIYTGYSDTVLQVTVIFDPKKNMVVPRLRESRLPAPSGPEFTQPRAHLIWPTLYSTYILLSANSKNSSGEGMEPEDALHHAYVPLGSNPIARLQLQQRERERWKMKEQYFEGNVLQSQRCHLFSCRRMLLSCQLFLPAAKPRRSMDHIRPPVI